MNRRRALVIAFLLAIALPLFGGAAADELAGSAEQSVRVTVSVPGMT